MNTQTNDILAFAENLLLSEIGRNKSELGPKLTHIFFSKSVH